MNVKRVVSRALSPLQLLPETRSGRSPVTLPSPSPFNQITAVILTYHRRRQCREVVKEFMRCGMSTIVLANDSSRKPWWADDSVVWLQSSHNLGLDSRFAAALLARTEYIFTTGDDLFVPGESILRLFEEAQKTGGLTGLVGRDPDSNNEYQLGADVITGTEMILSGGCLFRRKLIPLFFEAREDPLFREARRTIAALGSSHAENGEDLLFSYAIRKHLGSAGVVVQAPFRALKQGRYSLWRSKNHRQARTIMMRAGQRYAAQ